MINYSSGRIHYAFLVLTLALVIVTIFIAYSQIGKSGVITSYTECVSLAGSRLQGTIPEECITKDGQKFVRQRTDVEQQNLNPTNPIPVTSDLKVYRSEKYKYQFSYPSDYKIVEGRSNSLSINPKSQNINDYVYGRIFNVIALKEKEFEIRESDTYQDVVYSKKILVNNNEALQQILIGKPDDLHAPDSTHIKTQIIDRQQDKNLHSIVSFSTGLYAYITPESDDYLKLSDQDWEGLVENNLTTYDQILSTFRFIDNVSITTNKAEYIKGENVGFTVNNHTNKSIYFLYGCSRPSPYLIIENKSYPLVTSITEEVPAVSEIKSGETKLCSWDQMVWSNPKKDSPEKYREYINQEVVSPGVYILKLDYYGSEKDATTNQSPVNVTSDTFIINPT